jgi:hypothetical protein
MKGPSSDSIIENSPKQLISEIRGYKVKEVLILIPASNVVFEISDFSAEIILYYYETEAALNVFIVEKNGQIVVSADELSFFCTYAL